MSRHLDDDEDRRDDMTQPDHTMTDRLHEAMHTEVRHTMTMTDTPSQLRKLQDTISRRKRRWRITVLAPATAGVLALGSYLGVTLTSSSAHQVRVVTGPPTASLTTNHLGIPQGLAASVQVSTVHGPAFVGVRAFAAVWAISGRGSTGVLYRLSPDGQRILSQTSYSGFAAGPASGPFRVGDSIVVPTATDPNADRDNGYAIFNSNGRFTGHLTVSAAGPGVGDASGGWVMSANSTLMRLGSSGAHVLRQYPLLTGATISAVALGGGSVWVGNDTNSTVLRVDPATGRIQSQLDIPDSGSTASLLYTAGALYVSGSDHGLRRLDTETGRVTAVTFGHSDWADQILSAGPSGQLWTNPAKGVIGQLDPTTLTTLRLYQVYPNTRQGDTNPIIVTDTHRVIVGDVDSDTIYSFTLP